MVFCIRPGMSAGSASEILLWSPPVAWTLQPMIRHVRVVHCCRHLWDNLGAWPLFLTVVVECVLSGLPRIRFRHGP
jgi:hypothetical protein